MSFFGEPTVKTLVILRGPSVIKRELISCFQCGEVSDQPCVKVRVNVKIDSRFATIVNAEQRGMEALVLLDTKDKEQCVWKHWPSGASTTELPSPYPAGLLYVAVVVFVGLELQ